MCGSLTCCRCSREVYCQARDPVARLLAPCRRRHLCYAGPQLLATLFEPLNQQAGLPCYCCQGSKAVCGDLLQIAEVHRADDCFAILQRTAVFPRRRRLGRFSARHRCALEWQCECVCNKFIRRRHQTGEGGRPANSYSDSDVPPPPLLSSARRTVAGCEQIRSRV